MSWLFGIKPSPPPEIPADFSPPQGDAPPAPGQDKAAQGMSSCRCLLFKVELMVSKFTCQRISDRSLVNSDRTALNTNNSGYIPVESAYVRYIMYSNNPGVWTRRKAPSI